MKIAHGVARHPAVTAPVSLDLSYDGSFFASDFALASRLSSSHATSPASSNRFTPTSLIFESSTFESGV